MDSKIIIIGVSAAVVVVSLSLAGCKFLRKDCSNVQYTLPEGFTVTAHTGCEGEKDNTLASIEAGVKANADIVEIDLSCLHDGTPVLCHDQPKTNKMSKALPSLLSAFLMLKDLDVKMNVDVKTTSCLAETAELAKKCGVEDKIFFTGLEEKDIPAAKEKAPGIPYFLNVSSSRLKKNSSAYIDTLIEKVKSCGAIGINLKYVRCSKLLVEKFREAGLLVSVWTANEEEEMWQCLSYEPDNITTRYPSTLIKLMEQSK